MDILVLKLINELKIVVIQLKHLRISLGNPRQLRKFRKMMGNVRMTFQQYLGHILKFSVKYQECD